MTTRGTSGGAARPPLVVIGGGVRSGKSRFALERARQLGGPRRTFVATAEPLDGEMAERIARHQAERRNGGFTTLEEPLDLKAALESAYATADVVVVDCLTLWVSNHLMREAGAAALGGAFDRLLGALAHRPIPVLLVSNEVGLGLVPETPLGRAFRDHVGLLHQRLAAVADELYAGLMGALLRLRPAPVEAVLLAGHQRLDPAPEDGA
jgi:adenosylcobinamide kinase/adenosylcobinamide-phosphate guanylyltransferase